MGSGIVDRDVARRYALRAVVDHARRSAVFARLAAILLDLFTARRQPERAKDCGVAVPTPRAGASPAVAAPRAQGAADPGAGPRVWCWSRRRRCPAGTATWCGAHGPAGVEVHSLGRGSIGEELAAGRAGVAALGVPGAAATAPPRCWWRESPGRARTRTARRGRRGSVGCGHAGAHPPGPHRAGPGRGLLPRSRAAPGGASRARARFPARFRRARCARAERAGGNLVPASPGGLVGGSRSANSRTRCANSPTRCIDGPAVASAAASNACAG
jgi:hypothetical protein